MPNSCTGGTAVSQTITVRNSVRVPLEGIKSKAIFMTFNGVDDAKDHFAIKFESPNQSSVPLVRIHSECITGDLFGSLRCDCGEQLKYAVRCLDAEGGILIYLRQEGRGIGLKAKLDAYALQLKGHDTFEANRLLGHPDDSRDFGMASQMLYAMKEKSVRLLSNNPEKQRALENAGIDVVDRLKTPAFQTKDNKRYLDAKRASGHLIE